MSGLSLQQGCIYLPVFPVHMLGLGEVVCAKMGGTKITWHKEGTVPGSFTDHSALNGAEPEALVTETGQRKPQNAVI